MRAVPNRSKQVQCPAVSGNCFFPLIILNYGFGIVFFFFLGCMPSFESLALSNRHVVALLVLVCLRDLSTARKKTQNNTDFILQPHPVFPSLCCLLTAANKIWFVTVGLGRVRIPAALDMVYMQWWSSLPTFPTSLSSAAVL